MLNKMFRASVVLLLLPLAVTGCTFGPEKHTSRPIDPPPANANPVAAKQAESPKETSKTELYFLSDSGYVVPYALNIPLSKGRAIARDALSLMVKGGAGESMIPDGFSPILPKGTQLKGLNIQDGTATVDFSKEFLNYDPGQEEKMLEAVTWTLTGFPQVKEVNIWVEGKPIAVMPKKKTPAQGLTRENLGINLEVAEGTEMNRSMPVTLYFLGQTPDNKVYYVPVTRMVNETSNAAEVTIKELIKGPRQDADLSGALDSDTEVNKIQVKGDTVFADFGEQLLEYGNRSASKDALQTIVLSLTENTGYKKVKLSVNGKQNIMAAGEKDLLDQPVTRPKFVNPQSL
ncbi:MULTISPECIES: GerMN domain-containing protein [Thermoactinomyces]|jgi:germination protein M|uniref:GerMN domain-containing protein n=1 Tax=Thermoactinomyces daqus TaxID=1329516 RepID=A0A7W1X7G2_9BACL|nr:MULTISPECIES: GerMN domain-containing protein [Thermoactinomyces]MBA4541432.1 GerMN domain-containing protein [Thermoactinomyces daqus]MBH8596904.1 GerMN domain-containing protein [Thermoactinomyces sp. CICC 10523]MBH8603680.1 GerMN domain-containing protein [Thermoactinomyces sp. CICC 10522]MBH8607685.1 GerMN domain-containing protein [Thermoactinomyces sp. CICC 10521]